MLQSVLFDLDGTLVDSGPGILTSLAAVTDALGRPRLRPQLLQRFLGPPLQDGLAALLELSGAELADAVAVYRAAYRSRGLYDCTVYEGVVPMLDDLCSDGFRLAVATSKPVQFAEQVLEHVGLRDRFEVVRGASLDGAVRHKEQIVRLALTGLDLDAEAAVLVGDREHDVRGARACGLECFGAAWGYGGAVELAAAGAFRILAHPAELGVELAAFRAE